MPPLSAAAPAWTAHLPAGVDWRELDLTDEGSVVAAFCRHAAATPTADCLVTDERGTVPAGALEEESRRLAGRLRARGLAPGDRLLLSGEPSASYVAAQLAALRAGLVVVPMNTAYQPREIAHLVRDAKVRGALVDDPGHAATIAEVAGELLVNELIEPGGTLLRDPVAEETGLDEATGADPALVLYTSGTTGAPKGAVLSHDNLLASVRAIRIAWRWEADDRLALPLPLFHAHGLAAGVYGSLTAGSAVVLRRRFEAADLAEAITSHGATLLFGVPTIYARLVGSADACRALARLRLAVSGSAPLPAELHRALELRTGQRVLERYGMSETLMNTSNPYDGPRRAGTVGVPLPGVEVRLTGGDGPDGAIEVRGPNVFAGYLGRPEANADCFTDDGWFRTGDIGRLDEDGYLRIVGRSTELIISGGYNVYPREVEDVLRAHPAVADAAVVGRPDPEWGERVVAFVELRPVAETTVEELLAYAAGQLAAYKRPKQLHLVHSLPRTPLGKVMKGALG